MLILKSRILLNLAWRNQSTRNWQIAVFQEIRVLLEIQGPSFQKGKRDSGTIMLVPDFHCKLRAHGN